MKITDAVNEVILPRTRAPLEGLDVAVEGKTVILRDEFGIVKQMFTDDDAELASKVRAFWGDFLQDRSHRRMEKLKSPYETQIEYEVVADEAMFVPQQAKDEDEAQKIAADLVRNDFRGVRIYRLTRQEVARNGI